MNKIYTILLCMCCGCTTQQGIILDQMPCKGTLYVIATKTDTLVFIDPDTNMCCSIGDTVVIHRNKVTKQ